MEKYGTGGQNTDTNMHTFAWWIIKATNTHSEYRILIAFARQQWLRTWTDPLELRLGTGGGGL